MIYENVKAMAEKKGISLNALEKKAGLSKGTIPKWKTASPTIKSLSAVAKILGTTVDKLAK